MNYLIANLGFWKREGRTHFKKCLREAGIKYRWESSHCNLYIDESQKRLANQVIKKNKLYLSI